MSIILFHQNMVSKTTTIFDFKTTQTTKMRLEHFSKKLYH
jgi:hypothetical protein